VIRIDLHMRESINFAMSLWLRVCWVILVFLFGIEATLQEDRVYVELQLVTALVIP